MKTLVNGIYFLGFVASYNGIYLLGDMTPYRSAPQRHTHIVAERAREDFVEIEEPADTEEAKSEEVENRPADSADIKEMGAQGPEKEAEPKGRPAASV